MSATTDKPYQVLLYYHFAPLDRLEDIIAEQRLFCQSHGLLGRILVAAEGINGTISGLAPHTEAYMAFMRQHRLFRGIEFKVDTHHEHTFHKLFVREKPEIVHFGVPNASKPWEKTGHYIEPEQMRDIMRSGGEDWVIVDARSDYEWEVGRFRGAITVDIENFRSLPGHLDELKALEGKKILTYCTGGIKCEKLTAYMLDQGFDNVYQLHGGIIRYAAEAQGEGFDGSCYVFDERVVVPVNQVDPVVIGKCHVCGSPTERMINCANAACNEHILICDSCAAELEGCCSTECHDSPRRRRYDGTGQYHRGVNSKDYLEKQA